MSPDWCQHELLVWVNLDNWTEEKKSVSIIISSSYMMLTNDTPHSIYKAFSWYKLLSNKKIVYFKDI